MFGYIRPQTAEMKVKEHELYKAVYCGLCRSLGKCTGCVSKLTLSYDFVFLALVRMTLSGESGKIERRRCAVHPMKKRAMLEGADELDTAARLSALLTYHKLYDDIVDSKGLKKFGARMLVPAASGMKKKAELDVADGFIAEKLAELSELERNGCDSVDRAAEPFGELMSYVCAFGYEKNSVEERIASEIGRHIGRFVYITDAVADLRDDMKTGSYNPFVHMYDDPVSQLDAEGLKIALTHELMGVSAAVELMDFSVVREYGEIIKNIIYLGLPEVIDKTLSEYTCKNGTDVGEKEDPK